MTPKLLRAAAVLQVSSRSVRPMRDFFVDQLGFSVGTEVGAGPTFVTLDRDGQTIMLSCRPRFWRRPPRDWAAYFWVDDVAALRAEFEARGTPLKGGLTEKPYGCLELVAIAPDSREVVFGQRLENAGPALPPRRS